LQFLVGLLIQQENGSECVSKLKVTTTNTNWQSNSTILRMSFIILEIPTPIARVHNFPKIYKASHETSYMLTMHKYWAPQNKIRSPRKPDIWDLCTPTHNSRTIKNHVPLHVTFLTGNDLGNKLLKYWYEVLKNISRGSASCQGLRNLAPQDNTLHVWRQAYTP
jgi:hypothetical protein